MIRLIDRRKRFGWCGLPLAVFTLVTALAVSGGGVVMAGSDPADESDPSTQAPQEPSSIEEVPAGLVMCPVMTDEPAELNHSLVYKGQTLYFCCRRCITRFEADPASYVGNLPESVRASFLFDEPAEDVVETAEAVAEEVAPPVLAQEEVPVEEPSAAQALPESAAGDEPAGVNQTLHRLGRLHIVVIHYPIALLTVAGLFEFIGLVLRKPVARSVVRVMVAFGALSALVAVGLGLAHAMGETYGGSLSWVFWWHRALGIAAAAVSLVAWVAVERRARKDTPERVRFARISVLLTALVVAVAGHFGGSLVYGWDYLFSP